MAGNPFSRMFARTSGGKVTPTKTVGSMGTSIYGGYVQTIEDSADLAGQRKFKTYSEILANVSIAAAGVRYFLAVMGKATWSFTPSEADTDGRFAEMAEQIITDDPATPWHRIVKRAGMYRFYGFSVQEWTARRREDGVITLLDVAPRAQKTIERWDVDPMTGEVRGVYQRIPQTGLEVFIPRGKIMYVVDDSLSDSPEGLGLFRHIVKTSKALQALERLEGLGFETDLRGIPVGRGPFAALAAMEKAGELTRADRTMIEAPMREFIKNHLRNASSGLLLDSATYRDLSDAARPTQTPQWTVDLLKGNSTSLEPLNVAINRKSLEIARVLGVENMLLGGGENSGAYALSKDKTDSFFLNVNGALQEVVQSVRDDLLWTVWQLNGWPEEMMPTVDVEEISHSDVEAITSALRDMAQAGAVLAPDDPAINEVRSLMGLSPQPERIALEAADDASLNDEPAEGSVEDGEDDMPEGDE